MNAMKRQRIQTAFFVKSNEPEQFCPYCEGHMEYRDSVKRILRKEGGQKHWMVIRRLKCKNCNSLHRELPDCLLPYKHYETEIISGVLDGIVTPDDPDSENYPCVETMLLWLTWFTRNLQNIEGLLRRTARSIISDDPNVLSKQGSLLEIMRRRSLNWLERILRIIYNSGGRLPALGAMAFAPTSF